MQSTPSAAARRSHRSRRAAPRGRVPAHARTCISQAAKITYLHNAAGQRVFKSEPQTAQTLPDEQALGTGFVDWLRRNFQWLYATAQTNASIGTAYSFADQSLPSWALLGEYDNGSASGAGRVEYIWLPQEDGNAIPMAMFRGSRYFNIHSDHLGTPRLLKDDSAKPTWQWAYSAFGDNKPTGILKATTNPNAAITNQPTLLQATGAMEFNLRFPGQYLDQETGQFYNYFRSYQPNQGRYTQADPIGLDGGWNRFAYVEGNPISYTDPEGLKGIRDIVRGVTGLSGRPDSVEQMSRRHEKNDEKKNGYDTLTGYPIPVIPQIRPACVIVCPDAGNSCRPTPTNALPATGRPGCYQVCYPQGVK